MRTTFLLFICLSMATFTVLSQVNYTAPDGGWTYKYDPAKGDALAKGDDSAIDGTFNHDNGSDSWDGSGIGEAGKAPGGLSILDSDGIGFIRVQDAGNPQDKGFSDPSNRKLCMTHDLTQDLNVSAASTIIDDGVTIAFRIKLPKDGCDSLTSGVVYPATGDGFIHGYGGKGLITLTQAGGDVVKVIGFSLATSGDKGHDDSGLLTDAKDGLHMNKKNGTIPIADVSYAGQESEASAFGELNLLECDPLEWHEFWITIEPNTSGGGTDLVKIYLDGSTTSQDFHLTAGINNPTGDYSNYSFGSVGTGQSAAVDIDYMAIKTGVHVPEMLNNIAENYSTSQKYISSISPNPANIQSAISYSLVQPNFVTLSIYDICGKKLNTLVNNYQSAGPQKITGFTHDMEPGVYFYKLQVGEYSETKKFVIR